MTDTPLPANPYKVLGLEKDVDAETVKKTHHKLVLKYHPDRIKDPDLREEGKNKFTEVQAAYELLIDPERRARYDKEVRLAELQREYAAAEAVRAFSSYKNNKPTGTPRRESATDSRYQYDDRPANGGSYFDERSYYDDPLPRASNRKSETSYERERKTSGAHASEKKESSRHNIPAHVQYMFKAKLAEVHENKQREAFEKQRDALEREALREENKQARARNDKVRAQEERRQRDQKRSESEQFPRYMDDSSDNDTVTPKQQRRRGERDDRRTTDRSYGRSRMSYSPDPEPRRSSPSARKPSYVSGLVDEDEDVYERKHKSADDYINSSRAARPDIYRRESDARHYRVDREFEVRPPPSSRGGHREFLRDDDLEAARPGLHKSKSDKPNLYQMAEESIRDKVPLARHRSSGTSSNNKVPLEPLDLPQRFRRSDSDPVSPTSGRRETVNKSSTLKNEITDSGYASHSPTQDSSSRDDSPPEKAAATATATATRPSMMRETSTTYKISKNAGEESRSRLREVHSSRSSAKTRRADVDGREQHDSAGLEHPSRRDSDRHRKSSDENVERRRRSSRERGDSDRERRRSRERGSLDERRPIVKEERPTLSRGETDGRSRSTKVKAAATEDRPSLSRVESGREAKHETSPRPALFREFTTSSSRDRARTYDPAHLKTSKYAEPVRTKYTSSPSAYKPFDDDVRSTVSTSRPTLGRSGSSAKVSRSGIGVR